MTTKQVLSAGIGAFLLASPSQAAATKRYHVHAIYKCTDVSGAMMGLTLPVPVAISGVYSTTSCEAAFSQLDLSENECHKRGIQFNAYQHVDCQVIHGEL